MKTRKRDAVRADEELIEVAEAARRLSVGKSTVYRLIRKGELPSYRIGRLRRIRADDVRDMIDAMEPEILVPEAGQA